MAGQSVFVDAVSHGAALNVRGVNDAATSGAVTTVTSATAAFSANDTGRTFVLTSTAGAVTTGTLTYVSATSATMSVAAGGAMSGARLIIGTDDTTAWQNALNAATAGQVVDATPFTWRSLVTGNLSVPAGVTLGFEGRGPFDPQANPALNAHGPTFVMVQNSTAFVTLTHGSGVGDVIFYSANQKPPASATPTTYGAVISMAAGTAGVRIGSPYMPNAWIGIALQGGRHSVYRPQIGALSTGISIDQSLDVVDIDHLTCHPYWRICEGQTWSPTASTFDAYALSNAWALRIYRSDAFHVGSLFSFGLYGTIVLDDSPDTALSPRAGYGQVGMIDADYVAYGVYAKSVASPSLLVGSGMFGANGSGVGASGVAGVATIAGGTVTPKVVVKTWSHRGTWSSGASSNGAGTLIVPATNPG